MTRSVVPAVRSRYASRAVQTATVASPLAELHPDQLICAMTAARFLGVATRTLERWRSRGFGPRFVKIGDGLIRYRVRALVEWAAAREQTSTNG